MLPAGPARMSELRFSHLSKESGVKSTRSASVLFDFALVAAYVTNEPRAVPIQRRVGSIRVLARRSGSAHVWARAASSAHTCGHSWSVAGSKSAPFGHVSVPTS